MSPEQVQAVTYPVPYAALSAVQQAWANGTYTGTTSQVVCGWLGAAWGPTIPQNFDNTVFAMATLFEMSTTEQWLDIMYSGVDSRGTVCRE